MSGKKVKLLGIYFFIKPRNIFLTQVLYGEIGELIWEPCGNNRKIRETSWETSGNNIETGGINFKLSRIRRTRYYFCGDDELYAFALILSHK